MSIINKLIPIIIAVIILESCTKQNPNPNNGIRRITTNYTTVAIGSQVWMIKNLDISTYRNGYVITQVTDPT